MSEPASILPPNASPLERAMEGAIAATVPDLGDVHTLMNPGRCPPRLLAWLAWAVSVDEWQDDWSDDAKRETIRRSVEVHRRKGTVASIRRVIRAAGLGEVEIVERYSAHLFGEATPRDGSAVRELGDHWAEYRVVVKRLVSLRQAASLRRLLAATAPARSHLKLLDFREAALVFGQSAPRDGTYSRGEA